MGICIGFMDFKVVLNTNSRFYADFLRNYFQPLVCSDTPTGNDISIDIIWAKSKWKDTVRSVLAEDMVQIGGNTYLSRDKVAGVFKDKNKILFSWSKGQLRQEYRVIVRQEPPDSLWLRLSKAGSLDQDLYEITLRAVYHPLFNLFRRRQHRVVLHASAVIHCGEGIIFCGLDGSGKTSMSLFLSQQMKMRQISDNLIFADTEKIYPCFELMRLHRGSTCLSNNHDFTRWNRSAHFKDFYMPNTMQKIDGVRPKIVAFLGYHTKDRVEKLSVSDAVNRAINLTSLSGELAGYSNLCSLYDLLGDSDFPGEKEILTGLFNTLDCLDVRTRRLNGLEENIRFIAKELGV